MAKKRFTLSKSSLIRGKQCAKSLYFYKHEYNNRDKISLDTRAKFERGHQIGKLAQGLFPGGIDVSTKSPAQQDQSVKATQYYIQKQHPVIYEASFKHHGIFVALDILVYKDGAWHAYEVKSSPRISSVYLFDAAIQHYVIEQSGLPLKDFSIIHINDKYERDGLIDIQQLFTSKSVKRRLKKMNKRVAHNIELATEVIAHDQPPDIPIGRHCLKPYPCDFKSKCWDDQDDQSILSYVGLPITVKFEQHEKGKTRLDELDLNSLKIGYKSLTKIKASIDDRIIVEKKKLGKFLEKLSKNLYFFDIEATQSVIPLYQKSKPYQMIPFLYSLHKLERENGERVLTHVHHINRPNEDDRVAMIKHFLEHTKEDGDIIVFNSYLEKQALLGFIKLCPQYKEALEDRIKRLVDLEIPFKEMWYYHPKMQCSHSLKSVLPCLVDDMNYNDFKIKDGLEAMLSYQALIDHDVNSSEVKRRLKDLVEYCKMDTFALVKIFESLEELAE